MPEITRFDDGTRLVTCRGVDTGRAEVTEAYGHRDRMVSAGTMTGADKPSFTRV